MKAKPEGGRGMIEAAFSATKKAMGISTHVDWTSPYYQYCNRLATLHFLTENGVGARLLFIYFCGDRNPNEPCPSDEHGWQQALAQQYSHTGVTGKSELEKRVHSLFLPVVS